MSDSATTESQIRDFLTHLTHRPGVYRMYSAADELIYVGKARDLKRRVSSYFSGRATDSKTMALVRQIARIEVTVTPTEGEALILEANLIKQHRPRFNVVLRDDKSYPFIGVDLKHEFPRLFFYRGARRKDSKLYGPYPSAGAVRSTLGQLQKLFQIRQCENTYFANRNRPCLQYQIKRCTAPCVGLISDEDYARDLDHAQLFLNGRSDVVVERLAERMEEASAAMEYERAASYRDQIARLKRVEAQQIVQKGGGDIDAIGIAREGAMVCITALFIRGGRMLGSRNYFPRVGPGSADEEILRGFLLQRYSEGEAPKEILLPAAVEDGDALAEVFGSRSGHKVALRHRLRGDRRRYLELAATNAQQGAALKARSNATLRAQFESLATALEMEQTPERIECFDVSHTSGTEAVASCVVFGPEGAVKPQYRRFNIKRAQEGDDYAAMEEVVTRRYARVQREEGVVPDLVLIDGGPGQLRRARDALADVGLDDLFLVGVAKGQGRRAGREKLYVVGREQPIRLPADAPGLHLIQQIRDEAHRFAITGHRARRAKRAGQSSLEVIPGLGPKRRRDLLRQFGGLRAVSRAGVDDLARVKGISKRLAKEIYNHFHSDG